MRLQKRYIILKEYVKAYALESHNVEIKSIPIKGIGLGEFNRIGWIKLSSTLSE